jgi:hypothetical protein
VYARVFRLARLSTWASLVPNLGFPRFYSLMLDWPEGGRSRKFSWSPEFNRCSSRVLIKKNLHTKFTPPRPHWLISSWLCYSAHGVSCSSPLDSSVLPYSNTNASAKSEKWVTLRTLPSRVCSVLAPQHSPLTQPLGDVMIVGAINMLPRHPRQALPAPPQAASPFSGSLTARQNAEP